ncbi:isoleucine--tRNA ligase, mitochondrial-like [Lingula anatina]|uniref:Isoleucine--tRNA ligase, mitochondrial-like n=1 Tax=Lingula anatina TaxID=7574 RepID=A0A1S3HIV3_LINAN|nr:isoleucine--tRNA ligase, mitochondrial-like [Lingula anatina]|eukprot:XP_013386050.1 isoleucine--tRNA ligase, mitochondrial-like [Lingula anatina]
MYTIVYKKHDKTSLVDEDGCFTVEAGEELHGKNVLADGNNKVLDMLGSNVLHQELFEHSYPYDWRTDKPVIIRASRQWFIATEKIKERALSLLEDIEMSPPRYKQDMSGLLRGRPYWCISRQRAWGVPIPDKENEPAFGIDLLRYWAAYNYQDNQVSLGPSILKKHNTRLLKISKVLRYLVGNIHDLDSSDKLVEYTQLLPQDKYMLHFLYQFSLKTTSAYENYEFARVLNRTENFIDELSSFYCHVTKDRLLCSEKYSVSRLSALTVFWYLTDTLLHTLAPITPHIAEGTYSSLPIIQGERSVFKSGWFKCDPSWNNPGISEVMEIVLGLREKFYYALDNNSQAKEFDVVIHTSSPLRNCMKVFQPEGYPSCTSPLNEVFQAAVTTVLGKPPPILPDDSQIVSGKWPFKHKDGTSKEEPYTLVILPAENHKCPRCYRYLAASSTQPCDRCMEVIAGQWADY